MRSVTFASVAGWLARGALGLLVLACGARTALDVSDVPDAGPAAPPARDAGAPDAGLDDAGLPDAGTRPFLRFDGTDDRVTVAADPAASLDAFTFEATVRLRGDGVRLILSNRSFVAGEDADGFLFGVYNGQLFVQMSGSGNFIALGSPRLFDNRWHHLAATRAPDGELFLYVDGRSFRPDRLRRVAPIDSPTPLLIGYDAPTDIALEGDVRRIRIWGRALSPTQVSALAAGGSPEDTTELRAEWTFSEGMGQQTRDLRGMSSGVLGETDRPEPSDPSWASF
ncbi:MAG TPA: hypothetical protein DEF51_32260 [Myxococcales bacterium]|nr:hypothetical protein [Myxococcales bacterium]